MIVPQPTLDEVLAERERRTAVRRDVLARVPAPRQAVGLSSDECLRGATDTSAGVLVQLSPVAPASLRSTPDFLAIFAEGERRFEIAVAAMGWNPVRVASARTVLGPWTLWLLRSSAARPERVKYLCVTLEEELPFGRLWDFDVEGPSGTIGRAALDLADRTCVVCGGSAAVCSGRRVHPADEVAGAFLGILRRAGFVPEAVAS